MSNGKLFKAQRPHGVCCVVVVVSAVRVRVCVLCGCVKCGAVNLNTAAHDNNINIPIVFKPFLSSYCSIATVLE